MTYRKRLLRNRKKEKHLIVGTFEVAHEGNMQPINFTFSLNTRKNQKLIKTEPAHEKLKAYIKDIFEEQKFGRDAVHNVSITNIVKAI
jgi:hypothetical protein